MSDLPDRIVKAVGDALEGCISAQDAERAANAVLRAIRDELYPSRYPGYLFFEELARGIGGNE